MISIVKMNARYGAFFVIAAISGSMLMYYLIADDNFFIPIVNNEKSLLKRTEYEFALENQFEIYVRLTNTSAFRKQLHDWLFRSMNLFFPKYLAATVIVLDEEKSGDWDYGKMLLKNYPHMKLRLCFVKPFPNDVIHSWDKERMYLDMMHADYCSNRQFIGFVDVDTLFITTVTEDLLFKDKKPAVTARIGIPRIPCWIATAEFILARKQVLQCMSYFPVVFKIAHIIEMRQYVEETHSKPFLEVFEIAPKVVGVEGTCFCHFSIMCNYMWYFHHDAYAWHLQLVPGGNWEGKGAIPSMVNPIYFKNKILKSEKMPIPRSAVHARHLVQNGVYLDGIEPPKNVIDKLLKEGLCYSFGFELCRENCLEFDNRKLHDSLFAFENYRWQWDLRCNETQNAHYRKVHNFIDSYPQQFHLNFTSSQQTCKVFSDFR